MTDQYEEQYEQQYGEARYMPAAVRVAAVYPASDGRVPESIDVEIATTVDIDKVAPVIDQVVASLARVADNRHTFAAGGHISPPAGGAHVGPFVYLNENRAAHHPSLDLDQVAAAGVSGGAR